MNQTPLSRSLGPRVQVSAQLQPDNFPGLVAAGFSGIVNHRPDHEEPGQPTSAALAAAARAAGLNYRHLPVSGLPNESAVAGTIEAMAENENGELLMFCRSGMRSTTAWAMAERLKGVDAEPLREAALGAGYDLSRVPL